MDKMVKMDRTVETYSAVETDTTVSRTVRRQQGNGRRRVDVLLLIHIVKSGLESRVWGRSHLRATSPTELNGSLSLCKAATAARTHRSYPPRRRVRAQRIVPRRGDDGEEATVPSDVPLQVSRHSLDLSLPSPRGRASR